MIFKKKKKVIHNNLMIDRHRGMNRMKNKQYIRE